MLDSGEVSWGFQQKWQVCMHWVTTSKVDVVSSTYGRETLHGTQMVKRHNQNEIFWLIVVWGLSARALRLIDGRTIITLILVIELNTVAFKQSEPLGHGHYLFYPIDWLELHSLSDPKTLAIISSNEGSDSAKNFVFTNNKQCGKSWQWWSVMPSCSKEGKNCQP